MSRQNNPQLSQSQEDTLRRQLTGQGRSITDERILAAMLSVPRQFFVPGESQAHAYADGPIPIGYGQTISQPFVVAFMTQALQLKPNDRVLEIGVGCGYQTAVLSQLAAEVYGVEIVEPLIRRAGETLQKLGISNVRILKGDGYQGWEEHAPFDAILVACAPDHIPPKLVRQLRPGGRMVLPVGSQGRRQDLWFVEKNGDTISRKSILPVSFVPMTGQADVA